mgnify:CR=1 FL=1
MRKLVLLVLSLLAVSASAAKVQPLAPADIARLLAPPTQGVKIIELWALDCAYCESNLRAVAELAAARDDVEAVAVATDDIAHAEALAVRLESAGAADIPARAYAGAFRQRMDFLIDPDWGGETPRTLVIHADGSHRAASGELTRERLRKLLRD